MQTFQRQISDLSSMYKLYAMLDYILSKLSKILADDNLTIYRTNFKQDRSKAYRIEISRCRKNNLHNDAVV